jgi:hypothetical protein
MEDPTKNIPVRSSDDKTLYLYSNLKGFDKINLATWKPRDPKMRPMRFNVDSHELGLGGEDDDDGSALF